MKWTHTPPSLPSLRHSSLKSKGHILLQTRKRSITFTCQSTSDDGDGYLLDAPVSARDGFSVSGGKYSDGHNPADEWFKTGTYMKAHPIYGTGEKTKDPIFGLTMGANSQTSTDLFSFCTRWFCVESGNADKPSVVLVHGFFSQAYSYRKVFPLLSRIIILLLLTGFGNSDKPQPMYGFDYTLDEFVSALGSVIDGLGVDVSVADITGFMVDKKPYIREWCSNVSQ